LEQFRIAPPVVSPKKVALRLDEFVKSEFSKETGRDPRFGNFRALVVYQGMAVAGGGTSISAQIWGGIAACLNQARANARLSSLGLLGPLIYPLHGTSAFNDITVGTNGAYSAGPGYDLCTGLGSPNVAKLANALTAPPPSAPASPSSSAPASSNGGGGAPSYWFYPALTALFAIRKLGRARKR
jgi:hypothetical protein